MEEALDLSLLMPYNPVALSERRTLNAYLWHYEEHSKNGKLAEFV